MAVRAAAGHFSIGSRICYKGRPQSVGQTCKLRCRTWLQRMATNSTNKSTRTFTGMTRGHGFLRPCGVSCLLRRHNSRDLLVVQKAQRHRDHGPRLPRQAQKTIRFCHLTADGSPDQMGKGWERNLPNLTCQKGYMFQFMFIPLCS